MSVVLPNTVYVQSNGSTSTNPFIEVFETRPPTGYDTNYPIQKRWFDTVAEQEYLLVDFTSFNGLLQAVWVSTIFNADSKLTGDDGVVVLPTAGNINLQGLVVANGTHAKAVFTESPSASTEKIDVQVSTAIAATDITKVGLSAFNSAHFSVDASGFVSIINFSPFNYKALTFADSPYTVTATDEYISCDSSGGAITILFPNAPTQYRQWVVKDRTGSASTNAITLTTVGGIVTIDTLTSQTLAGNFDAVNLLFNGTSYEVY